MSFEGQSENGFVAKPNIEVPIQRPEKIIPISEELRVLKVTVDRSFVDDLEKVKDALSHKVPKGELSQVLHECIRLALKTCEKYGHGDAGCNWNPKRATTNAGAASSIAPAETAFVPPAALLSTPRSTRGLVMNDQSYS